MERAALWWSAPGGTWPHVSASPFRAYLFHITDFYHYDLSRPKNFLHTQLSGAPQKYFQSGPAHAKAGLVRICIFTIKLCHEFALNLLRKSCEINYLTISGYYPVNRLAKLQISGYIRYPDSKTILISEPTLINTQVCRPSGTVKHASPDRLGSIPGRVISKTCRCLKVIYQVRISCEPFIWKLCFLKLELNMVNVAMSSLVRR